MRRFVIIVTAALVTGCATNPVTGRRELSLVSEAQEISMGKAGSVDAIRSIGLLPDSAIQRYVRTLAGPIAARSERPNLPWEFHVLDDAAVNAFAMPGGFIFVTRGLLTHLNSEAELVSVLGHEIGHVTAKHSVSQISRAQATQLALGVGSVLSSTVAKFGDLAGAGLGLMFLKFGRDDELESDQLGFRYTLDSGYDVREMANVFRTLERQMSLAGVGKLPEWQSTHPDPGNRVRATQERLASVTGLEGKRVGRDELLARLDGMIFGENPRHGYFEGTLFLHPDLAFRLVFPDGWRTQNQPTAVAAMSPAGDAITQLGFAEGSAEAAARAFFAQQGIQPGPASRVAIHGLPAVSGEFAAASEGGTIRGLATFIEHNRATYRILSYTPAERWSGYAVSFQRAHGSFERVTDPRVLGVQPRRVKLERAPRAMSLAMFHAQLPSQVTLEELAVINGMEANQALRPGQLVKRVVR